MAKRTVELTENEAASLFAVLMQHAAAQGLWGELQSGMHGRTAKRVAFRIARAFDQDPKKLLREMRKARHDSME